MVKVCKIHTSGSLTISKRNVLKLNSERTIILSIDRKIKLKIYQSEMLDEWNLYIKIHRLITGQNSRSTFCRYILSPVSPIHFLWITLQRRYF